MYEVVGLLCVATLVLGGYVVHYIHQCVVCRCYGV